MGLSPFNRSCSINDVEYVYRSGNPVATNYKIVKSKSFYDWCVIKIVYPDCNNYEGNKICVYNYHLAKILSHNKLDPHFSQNDIAPFARLEPTEKGWAAAIGLIKLMQRTQHD
jgi:hypothetical protein